MVCEDVMEPSAMCTRVLMRARECYGARKRMGDSDCSWGPTEIGACIWFATIGCMHLVCNQRVHAFGLQRYA